MVRAALRIILPALWLGVWGSAPVGAAHHEPAPNRPPAEAAPSTLRIRGTVVNGTLQRPPAEGLDVRLVAIEAGKVRALGSARTTEDGSFSFEGVEPPEGGKGHLIALTRYQGVPYMALVTPGGEEPRLLVFDLTENPSGIVVETHQTAARYEEGRLIFLESVRLANTGNAAYASSAGETLVLTLPDGAELLQPPGGLNPQGVRISRGRVISSDPIPPGLKEVTLSYAIADPPAQLRVEEQLQFPTKQFAVMVPEFGMRLPSPTDLKYEGVFGEDLGNRSHVATKSDLPAGARVRFTISRDVRSAFVETMFLGIAALVLVGLAVPFAMRRRRLRRAGAQARPKSAGRPARAPDPPLPGREELAAARRDLVRRIAELDDECDAGRLSRQEHDALRTELKRQAVDLSKKIQGS